MITDYHIEKELSVEGGSKLLFGVSEKDHREVILKWDEKEGLGPLSLSSLKHDYQINSLLTGRHILHPLDCFEEEKGSGIVFEGVKGTILKEFLRDQQPSLKEFLRLALEMAQALVEIHGQGVIHRNIN